MQMASQKVLIVGTGLLGTSLFESFSALGVNTVFTTRGVSDESRRYVETGRAFVCNSLSDYEQAINKFNPNWIINTIPQAPTDLLSLLLRTDRCTKIEFSSPASDFARVAPEKCPPGSYPGDKLSTELLFNKRGVEHRDALVIQIGFIPEVASVDNKPVLSGLSFDTMVMCNLLTGFWENDINQLDKTVNGVPVLRSTLNNYDKSKGFTCTPVDNVFRFVSDLVIHATKIPNEAFGRTLAMHSSQVWPRSEIINAISNEHYLKNPLPEFYGQKSEDKITKPVTEFKKLFPKYSVRSEDVLNAIQKTALLFKNQTNRELMINTLLNTLQFFF